MGIFYKIPLPAIGGVAALIVILLIITVAFFSDKDDDNTTSAPGSIEFGGESSIARDQVEAEFKFKKLEFDESDRVTISAIGVDAPLTYRKVGSDGIMPNPESPDDIAIYDFREWRRGGYPGEGGRIVLAGHVDSGREPCDNGRIPPPCEAVLWDLNNLDLGDEITITIDGISHVYSVRSNEPVDAIYGAWSEIISSTRQESLVVITCGGDFNRETNEYAHRQVVVAVKISVSSQ